MRELTEETIRVALGRDHRHDPALERTGGPAGNARLTAWSGLVLLALLLVELVTLLDVRGLVSWHIAVGALLVPPALLKTATTGWRIVRYYAGAEPRAGRQVRLVLLVAMLAIGALLAGVLVRGDGAWSRDRHYEGPPPLRSSKAT